MRAQRLLAAVGQGQQHLGATLSGLDHQRAHEVGGARITSYNVCYTKLLRSPSSAAVLSSVSLRISAMEGAGRSIPGLSSVRRRYGVDVGLPALAAANINRITVGVESPNPELAVITSYSIHYTKLYDLGPKGQLLTSRLGSSNLLLGAIISLRRSP